MKHINNSLVKSIEDVLYYDPKNSIEYLVITMFETILKAERSEFLNNCPENNKANGFYTRMVRAINKYFKLSVPRDRMGIFKPIFLELIKEQESQMFELASKLYTKGLSTRDIEDIMGDVFGKKMSASQVSLISKSFQDEKEAWLNRKLLSEYYFIYIDALYVPIRRNTVENEAIYIVMGLKSDLKREVLGVYNIPTESASGWNEVFCDLKNRGLEKVLMIVADGLTGLEEVVSEQLPNTFLQKCLVHKIRNILLKARSTDKQAIVEDFRSVFRLEEANYSVDDAIKNLEIFVNKWKKRYTHIEKKFKPEHLKNYFAYLNFPYQIQRMIYTTNWIERLNKHLRKTLRVRNSFPNPDSAINLICASLMDFENKVYDYPVTSFLIVKDKLDFMLKNFFD